MPFGAPAQHAAAQVGDLGEAGLAEHRGRARRARARAADGDDRPVARQVAEARLQLAQRQQQRAFDVAQAVAAFIGVGDSLVYHFQCKSTGKVVKNDGRRQFLDKWGLTQSTFDRHYLHRGEPAVGDARLADPDPTIDATLRWDLRRSRLRRRFG